MNRQTWTKEVTGILIAILFLALGLLGVWGMHKMELTAGDAVFVSLLLVPFITYVILTGRVSELKGPGGLEAQFVAMARRPTEELAIQHIEFVKADIGLASGSGVQELARLKQLVAASKRVILTLPLGRSYYGKQAVETYIERFLPYQNFIRYLVFLDKKDRFVAFIAPAALLPILKGEQGDRFIEIINKGDVLELLDLPGVMTRTISTRATNMDALREMTEHNLDAILVLDDECKLKGEIEREQVLSKLMLGMMN
jgi:hypothetical protein